MSKGLNTLLVMALALAWAPYTQAQSSKGAAFEAGLVRCTDVTVPTRLANCGADRIQDGTAEITEEGEVEVRVVGAAPNVLYSVVYRSMNGPGLRALGELTTNAQGNGFFTSQPAFAPGQVGSGNLVLRRDGLDQFVTGFKVGK